ncbi:MAG: ribonuclease H [Desulfobacteraceae bacterium]
MTENEEKSWKRMSFKQNKVWAETDKSGNLKTQKGKVLIKYNLKQNYQYQVKAENLEPEEKARTGKKNAAGKKKATAKKTAASVRAFVDRPVPENAITIYTDGASSGNPGPSGIGVFFCFGEHTKEISEYIGESTNNIAELTAIKRALDELKRDDLPVRLYTDSSYAIGLLQKGWKPRKNVELVNTLKALTKKFTDLEIIKIKGHAGIEGNETADRLATSAIKKG